MWVVADERLQSLGVTGEKKKCKRGEEVPLFRTIDWLLVLIISFVSFLHLLFKL
jgi:hypothetical protein